MSSNISPPALAGERPLAFELRYLPPAARALVGLAPDQCRWPTGEPGEAGFHFCPERRAFRSRYCAHHALRARAGTFP